MPLDVIATLLAGTALGVALLAYWRTRPSRVVPPRLGISVRCGRSRTGKPSRVLLTVTNGGPVPAYLRYVAITKWDIANAFAHFFDTIRPDNITGYVEEPVLPRRLEVGEIVEVVLDESFPDRLLNEYRRADRIGVIATVGSFRWSTTFDLAQARVWADVKRSHEELPDVTD